MKKINKPWGYELIWADTTYYIAKILHINAGHSLSRQFHDLKEETFLVWSGSIKLEIGFPVTEIFYMNNGDTFNCNPKTIHRIIAVSDSDIIEVSTNYPDDIIRLEDNYNRA